MRALRTLTVLLAVLLVAGCTGDGTGEETSPGAAAESSSAADTLIQSGLAQLRAGRDVEARTSFANALSLEPANVYAHYNLGLIAQRTGDDVEAAKHYDAALETDPDFTSALYNRAILLETSDLGRAVDLYQHAIEVEPDLAAAHMRLGFALLHLGRTAQAEVHLATGVRLDPAMASVEAPSYD
jgi:Tfp pilus assembly protein PilF